MATDERRRKVAAELRELAANRHYVDEFIAADTVGFAKPRYCPECGMEVGE